MGDSSGTKKRSVDEVVWPDVVDDARRAYNVSCARVTSTLDSRGGNCAADEVAKKTAAFMKHFSARIIVTDLLSQKPILEDAARFQRRYQTVFRESGLGLEMAVHARLVFLPGAGIQAPGADALVLDYERHTSLVTPVGASLDGSLGLRGPRVQDLWALYSVRDGFIEALWLTPPVEGAGAGTTGDAALAQLEGSRQWHAFLQIVERRLGAGFTRHSGPLHSSRVGCYEMQGRRPTQEDKLSVQQLRAPHLSRPAAAGVQWLGLFDGHGGSACAHFAAEHLHQKVAAARAFRDGDLQSALRAAFRECEAAFFDETDSNAGACALVALCGGGQLHVAHLGDSRAVLCSGESAVAIPLTEDHKPDSAEERARIEKAGGAVVRGGRCWRVTHAGTSMMLATSRSFGDRGFKQSWEAVAHHDAIEKAIEAEADGEASSGAARPDEAIPPLLSPIPTISSRPIAPADRFLILACDGVWDVLSDQQACDCVRAALEEPHGSAEAAARKLAGDAYYAGSEDNISVIVMTLRHELV
jgi:protein phosphatase 2C family protein 2/3